MTVNWSYKGLQCYRIHRSECANYENDVFEKEGNSYFDANQLLLMISFSFDFKKVVY